MRDGLGRWQRVLVLGGTSDIGLAVLAALPLGVGAEVMLAGRDRGALAVVDLPAGTRRRVEDWDAAVPGSGQGLLRRVREGGDVDLVLVAAGRLAADSSGDGGLLQVNAVGVVEALSAAADVLRAQRHGQLVVLSSVAAVRARRSNYAYGASKAALDAYAQGLSDALHGSGVGVLVVRPGFVHSRMTQGLPAAPLATTPQVVARAVARALARPGPVSRTVWVPAAFRAVSLGLQLVPRRLWRRLDL